MTLMGYLSCNCGMYLGMILLAGGDSKSLECQLEAYGILLSLSLPVHLDLSWSLLRNDQKMK